ncbi:hypothetical protein IC229_20090 [Spirosoma sp. BT702]|uniref:Uncharacterized protein n=1 Tax=Spirosoma profusum TaxID=2771354 RepID=A0A927ARW7_9BACT|nr:hypothetical protein [Spirosoma profusum]MBD2702958.1 hypothetical protein [Spirosoma profusum]
MASHALDQRLFEKMASLTTPNDSVSDSTPERLELIDGWLKVIEGDERTELIQGKLIELREALKPNHPDVDQVQTLLFSLADHTSQVAQGSQTSEQLASKLEQLATTLRQLAGLQIVDSRS